MKKQFYIGQKLTWMPTDNNRTFHCEVVEVGADYALAKGDGMTLYIDSDIEMQFYDFSMIQG